MNLSGTRKKKEINIKKVVEKLQERGIDAQICKRSKPYGLYRVYK